MIDPIHEWLVRGTAIAVIVGYLVRIACEIGWQAGSGDARWGRRLVQSHVAVGLLLLLHIVVAFHFWHHWSVTHALAHTARRTAEVTGFNTDVGLLTNFAFVAAWWWYLGRVRRWVREPVTLQPWLNRLAHSTVLFFVFNATVVFGPRYWIAIAALSCAALLVFRQRSRSASTIAG